MASLQSHRRHLPINAKMWHKPFDGSRPTIRDIKKEDVPVLTHPRFPSLFNIFLFAHPRFHIFPIYSYELAMAF
jgi:hypothetical protein